jgi:hypothetical protein
MWKLTHYLKSGKVIYHLCSRVGILQGTYGREDLELQPDLNATLMGIDLNQHVGKPAIKALQAHKMY